MEYRKRSRGSERRRSTTLTSGRHSSYTFGTKPTTRTPSSAVYMGSGLKGRSGGGWGSRRGRRHSGRAVFAVALVGVGLVVIALYAFSRPVNAVVSASPKDATVTFAKLTRAGSVAANDVEPGIYAVRIERTGYRPLVRSVDVRRFARNSFEMALEPMPLALRATLHPADATWRVTRAGKTLASGTGSLDGTVTAGPVRIDVTAEGRNPLTREIFLEAPTSLELWLDPKGQLVHGVGLITTSGAPKGVAVTPNGREAWATILNGPPSIEIFDVTNGKRTGEIDLGKYGAVEIVFTRDGKRAYASQMETAKAFEIDTRARKVLRAFDTESAWSKVVALSPDEETLYVANWSGNDVSDIDLGSGKLRRRIPVMKTPRGLYPTEDGRFLYVGGFDKGELERIDLASGEVATLFDGGGALRHLVGNAKTGILYASDMAKDCVWAHDMKTGKTWKFVDTDHRPNTIELSPDGRVLFVSNRGENNAKSYYIPGPEWGSILLFDAASGKPLDAIVGGNQCTALDVSDDGRTLVFSDFLDNRLRVYEVPAYATLSKGDGGRFAAHTSELTK